MKVLWAHNFDPEKPKGLLFMNNFIKGIQALGIDVELEYLGNLRSATNLLRVRRRLRVRAKDFDLVHAHYGSACALATAGIQGVPKVLSIRGNDWNVHDETFGFLYWHTRLARYMSKRAIPSYDCVLAVSERIAAELKEKFPHSRIETLPSPVDLKKFVPRHKAEARALLGYPDCTKRWVLFNTLRLDDPVKRYPLARAAFDLANAKCGNLRLMIAHDLPHERLPLFVAACDLILCTSETEGWPNSVKEAIACDVPFVSTDVSDLRDIARQEPTCRICPPDAVILAENICDVLASPKRPGIRRHVCGMSLEAGSQKLANLYESLISRRARWPMTASRHVKSV